MKKRLMGFAACALVLASCSNNEISEINSTNPDYISFDAFAGKNTKATIVANNNIDNFGIFAFDGGYTTSTTSTASFMPNHIYKSLKSGQNWSSGPWSTDPGNIKKWSQLTQDKVDFIAYYPATEISKSTSSSVNNGYKKMWDSWNFGEELVANGDQMKAAKYEIPKNATDQQDILVANTYDVKKPTSGIAKNVQLSFKHATSQIRVKILLGNSALTAQIKSIKIVGVKNSGSLDMTKANSWDNNAWNASLESSAQEKTFAGSSAIMYDYNYFDGKVKELTGVDNSTDLNKNFMLIPQTEGEKWPVFEETGYPKNPYENTNGAVMVIEYTMKEGDSYIVGANNMFIPAGFPLNLKETPWQPGKIYTYNITLGNGDGTSGGGGYYTEDDPTTDAIELPGDPILSPDIKFSVDVDEWSYENATNPNPENVIIVDDKISDLASLKRVIESGISTVNESTTNSTSYKLIFTGEITTDLTVDPLDFAAYSKIKSGTTVNLDFSKVDGIDSKNITISVSSGWTVGLISSDHLITLKKN